MKTEVKISQWEASEIVRHLSNYHVILQVLSSGDMTDECIEFMKRYCKHESLLCTRIDATMDKYIVAMEADVNKCTDEEGSN